MEIKGIKMREFKVTTLQNNTTNPIIGDSLMETDG